MFIYWFQAILKSDYLLSIWISQIRIFPMSFTCPTLLKHRKKRERYSCSFYRFWTMYAESVACLLFLLLYARSGISNYEVYSETSQRYRKHIQSLVVSLLFCIKQPLNIEERIDMLLNRWKVKIEARIYRSTDFCYFTI